ncbi:MAG: hypothetical protein R3B48_25485 [Kofleriaceae bacterium]
MKTALLSIALLALVSCSRPSSDATEVSERDASRLLYATPWLDHMPAHEGDAIELLQFDPRHNGVYIKGNAYRGGYDVFRYERTRSQLKLTFPADGEVAETGYRIERIKRGGFDLRLTLTDSPRGPSAYYGFEQRRELPESVQRLLEARGR